MAKGYTKRTKKTKKAKARREFINGHRIYTSEQLDKLNASELNFLYYHIYKVE